MNHALIDDDKSGYVNDCATFVAVLVKMGDL